MGHGFNLQTTTLAPTLPDLRRLRRLLPGPISWGDGIITGKSWAYDCLYIYIGTIGDCMGQYMDNIR